MENTADLLAKIGHDKAATALGVAVTRIKRATFEDRLPAAWYDALERLAGEPLPRALFTFKGQKDDT